MIWNISGYDVLIDDEDYERLKGFKYYPTPHNTVGGIRSYYFLRNTKIDGVWHKASLHRDIMQCVYKDNMTIDHTYGNTLDNRKVNLRLCTHTENSRNQRLSVRNTSGIKGVSYHKRDKKWCANIKLNNHSIYLGSYSDIKDAEAAYAKASKEFHGEFGRTK